MYEEIKAEIERLKKEFCDNPLFRTVRSETAKEFADKFLSFIESMEKEQDCNGEVDDDALTKQLKIWFEKGKAQARDEFNALPKIKGWVAKDNDWMYHFFRTKPQYYEDFGEWSNAGERYLIPGELCHSVEDEPIEVELTIHRV